MKKLFTAAALLAVSLVVGAQTSTVTAREDRGFQPMLGTSNIGKPVGTEALCEAAIAADVLVKKKTALYKCRNEKVKLGTYSAAPPPVVCPTAPTPSVAVVACAAPLVGQWTQTTTVAIDPATCTRTVTLAPQAAPAGACAAVPPPPPPVSGPTVYLSDCQAGAVLGCVPGSNGNPGTEAMPKQSMGSINVNALPAGARLLFKRGGAWLPGQVTIDNPNASAAAPITFDAYGNGPAPVLRQCAAKANLFNLGGGWNNTSDDGGYTFRNLKFDGCGTAEWGVWFVQNVRDVVFENMEITGFRIALNSNDGTPYGVKRITLRNSNIVRNVSMGILGHYSDTLIEGNNFEANNFGGSTFDHGTYIGGGHNITIRNNRYVRNSTVNGTCTGGNMTFHGQIDGLLIEGNTIVQDASAPGCWLMSITQGYATPEWFRNTIVRGNTFVNGGNNALAVNSAPGIVVERNLFRRTQPGGQTAISILGQYTGGDVPDENAVVRDNTVCRVHADATGGATNIASPGGSVTNNVVRTGADATSGPCQ